METGTHDRERGNAHLKFLAVEVNFKTVVRIDDGVDGAVDQGFVKVQDQGKLLPVPRLALLRECWGLSVYRIRRVSGRSEIS